MTKIYLVRHCEAEGNTLGVLQGRSDCGISGNAPKQLELVSLRLRNVPFSAIYSSPLQRAYRTALAIGRYHGLGIRKDEKLVEIDMGSLEGRSWKELQQSEPELVKTWNESLYRFDPPGGESVRHVASRMWGAVLGIARGNPGKTVCAVSHGCAIRSFLCLALGRPLERLGEIPWCDNTAVSVVEIEGEKARVLSMNDASHLPPELSVYRGARTAGGIRNLVP